ncbi:MAG TPA: hypothetical protein VGM83_13800 [Devosiaceae bacterium]|jgi:hypothetical protein
MSNAIVPALAEVEIVRTLNLCQVGHLDEELASSEDGIGLNLAYFDARGWDASDVDSVLQEENELLDSLAAAGWTTNEAAELLEEHFSDWTVLSSMDAGMGGAVLALSAAGATPISSCNGGTIGIEYHSSDVPHILFAGSDAMDAAAIQFALETADLGAIVNAPFGEIYADQVLKFSRFARVLVDRLLDGS